MSAVFRTEYRYIIFLGVALLVVGISFASVSYPTIGINLLLTLIFLIVAICNIEIALMIIVLLLPFTWNYVVFKIADVHVYATYLMILLTGLSLLLRNITYGIKWVLPREAIYLAIFWLFSVLSILKSSNITLSIKESAQVLYYICEFLVVVNIVKGKSSIKKIVLTLILSVSLVNAVSTYIYMTGGAEIYDYPEREIARASLLSLNPVLLGGYLSLCCPILISLAMDNKIDRTKKLALFTLAMWTFILILLSYSRGAIFASAAGIVLLIFLLDQHNKWKRIVLIISLFMLFLAFPSSFSQHLTKTKLEAFDTLVGRVYLSTAALFMIKDNPILGIGIGTFPDMLVTQYSDIPFPINLEKYITFIRHVKDSAHNAFLQYCAEIGTIGFLFFLLALIRLIKSTKNYITTCGPREPKEIYIGLLVAFLVIIIHNLTVTSLTDYFWILFAVLSSIVSKKNSIQLAKNA